MKQIAIRAGTEGAGFWDTIPIPDLIGDQSGYYKSGITSLEYIMVNNGLQVTI